MWKIEEATNIQRVKQGWNIDINKRFHAEAKKIIVLFPEPSEYILGLVGSQKFLKVYFYMGKAWKSFRIP